MTKINLGKSSVKTSGTPPNQNSKPYNVIKHIANKMQTLSPQLSPDTKKEFWRATATKASSQERNDVTVFEKMIQ